LVDLIKNISTKLELCQNQKKSFFRSVKFNLKTKGIMSDEKTMYDVQSDWSNDSIESDVFLDVKNNK